MGQIFLLKMQMTMDQQLHTRKFYYFSTIKQRKGENLTSKTVNEVKALLITLSFWTCQHPLHLLDIFQRPLYVFLDALHIISLYIELQLGFTFPNPKPAHSDSASIFFPGHSSLMSLAHLHLMFRFSEELHKGSCCLCWNSYMWVWAILEG